MKRNGIVILAFAATASGPQASAAEDLRQALGESEPIIDWRLRYESVDQTGFMHEAEAFTSRLRAGVRTGKLGGTALLAEGVWVEDVLDDYDSTTNGEADYPIVADPTGFARVNRFALTNESLENAVFTLGRQRIIHDDARFVGNVGWRQHEQTFDGVRAQLALGASSVDLAYANQVNRIFGPDSRAGKWEGDIVLAQAAHAFDWGQLAVFGYLLELDDAAPISSNTFGLKVTGSKPLGERLSVSYTAAYARQTDREPNPVDFEEDYTLLEAGLAFGDVTIRLGRETFGGDGSAAFSTPLATLHAFQGWADKFLSTPPAGLEDTYVGFGYALGATGPFDELSALAVFHHFGSNADSTDYGDELDLSLVGRVARMTFTLKYADYSAEQLLTDTGKVWLSMDYAFQ